LRGAARDLAGELGGVAGRGRDGDRRGLARTVAKGVCDAHHGADGDDDLHAPREHPADRPASGEAGMKIRALTLVVIACQSACAVVPPPRAPVAVIEAPRLANLKRAATLPWTDDGRCAVREASAPWATLIERCYRALDLSRIRFNDPDHRCAVASV